RTRGPRRPRRSLGTERAYRPRRPRGSRRTRRALRTVLAATITRVDLPIGVDILQDPGREVAVAVPAVDAVQAVSPVLSVGPRGTGRTRRPWHSGRPCGASRTDSTRRTGRASLTSRACGTSLTVQPGDPGRALWPHWSGRTGHAWLAWRTVLPRLALWSSRPGRSSRTRRALQRSRRDVGPHGSHL